MRQSLKSILLAVFAIAIVNLAGSCSPEDPPAPTQPQVQPPPVGTKSVNMTAFPGSIPADGISSTLIVAYCFVGGQQAPDNLPVRITTDAGDFSLDGVNPISDTDVTRSVSLYTAGGRASIYLISDYTPDLATVSAVFGSEAVGSVAVRFVRKDQDVGGITLKLTPDSGTAPLTVEAEATVVSKDAKPLSDVRVEFSVNDDAAKLDKKKVKTDVEGKASTHIRNIKRDTSILAKVGKVKARHMVEITNEDDKNLKLDALQSNGSAYSEPVLINNSAQLLLRATVMSESSGGTPVPDATVNFSSGNSSAYFSKNPVVTNSNGEAETYVQNITSDTTITAKTKNSSDTLAVKINKPPIAIINKLSGTATADQVNVLVFSAGNSYDPDLPFGDTITYNWSFALQTTNTETVAISEDATSDNKVVTLTIGSSTGGKPLSGDVLTIVLTVTDANNLTATDIMTITWP